MIGRRTRSGRSLSAGANSQNPDLHPALEAVVSLGDTDCAQFSTVSNDAAVRRSVAAYAWYARRYDRLHIEIFNGNEQRRLGQALDRAAGLTKSGGHIALDYGCGTGNITTHLLRANFDVIAADVSPHFLRMVRRNHNVETLRIGAGPESVPDGAFDLIGLYSVLHHVQDYLGTVAALVPKLKPGGVLFIDHEHTENYWTPDPAMLAFRADMASTLRAQPKRTWDPERKRWQYLLRAAASPRRNYHRIRRHFEPRWSREGDIHVWPDDHIDHTALRTVLENAGADIVAEDDYLLFTAAYDEEVWARYRELTTDMRTVVARRIG